MLGSQLPIDVPRVEPRTFPTAAEGSEPLVSFIVPVYNEEDYLRKTLETIRGQRTEYNYELLIVDGGSEDDSRVIAEDYDATVLEQDGTGIGDARDTGANHARGEWFAFVDADTTLKPTYLNAMIEYAETNGLVALSSRCRIVGTRRAKPLELITNHVFPHNDRPMLPGFNTFVRRESYFSAGGYENVPNEDKALSRDLAAVGSTGFHPSILVETSARRIERYGLVGTVFYYLHLDIRAIRSDNAGEDFSRSVLSVLALTVLGGLLQLYHGLAASHATAVLAVAGFLGGAALFVMDFSRRRLPLYGVLFVGVQIVIWGLQGFNHGVFGLLDYGEQVALGGALLYSYWAVQAASPTSNDPTFGTN